MSDHTEIHTHHTSPGGTALPLLGYAPTDAPVRAVAVLFHGGGWRSGGPEQFAPQGRVLAAAGVLTFSAAYRLLGGGAQTLGDCVEDARAAVRHVRRLAKEQGLADAPFFLGGGSSGGQLALTVAHDSPADGQPSYSGLVLFNPVVDLLDEVLRPLLGMVGLTEETAAAYSPLHLVRPRTPPMLVQHGTADQLVPIAAVRRFRDAEQEAGNDCRLVEYPDAPHGFFNPGTENASWASDSTEEAVGFVLERMADPR
ncbi:alpha/beta hydrolase [Streptacidiphilus fuscans]|uniref:Alpha/beta hydrolase n=1 Tax=Streptacidiphilus fuscans TaxID=2789292 RepID=A0A931B477_9ACTN|nr:alpha/beta hydrolase [Streptacidiphilus fuscans]MBF9069037.1 alpha/beta hydrolase [Streptacidiphilus fuscans]